MSLSASWQDTETRSPSAARQRAFKAARRHSRRVRALRILLPTAGLAAIVGLFALARLGLPLPLDLSMARLSITPNAVIMEHPNLTGFDGEQREYSVAAERAIQSLTNPNQVQLEAIKARIGGSGQEVTTVTAAAGQYDHGKRTLRLEGDVTVDSTEGYALRMTDVRVDFSGGTMQSDNPVTVTFADSRITSQRFQASDNGKRLLFDGGVSTVVMPPKRAAEAAAPTKAAE